MTASGGAAGSGGSLPNSCRSKPQLLTPFFFWLRAAERGGGRTHCWGFRRSGATNAGPTVLSGFFNLPVAHVRLFLTASSQVLVCRPRTSVLGSCISLRGESVFDFVPKKGPLLIQPGPLKTALAAIQQPQNSSPCWMLHRDKT